MLRVISWPCWRVFRDRAPRYILILEVYPDPAVESFTYRALDYITTLLSSIVTRGDLVMLATVWTCGYCSCYCCCHSHRVELWLLFLLNGLLPLLVQLSAGLLETYYLAPAVWKYATWLYWTPSSVRADTVTGLFISVQSSTINKALKIIAWNTPTVTPGFLLGFTYLILPHYQGTCKLNYLSHLSLNVMYKALI